MAEVGLQDQRHRVGKQARKPYHKVCLGRELWMEVPFAPDTRQLPGSSERLVAVLVRCFGLGRNEAEGGSGLPFREGSPVPRNGAIASPEVAISRNPTRLVSEGAPQLGLARLLLHRAS